MNSRTQVKAVTGNRVMVVQRDDGMRLSLPQEGHPEIRLPCNQVPAFQEQAHIMTAVHGQIGVFIGIHLLRFAQRDRNVDSNGAEKSTSPCTVTPIISPSILSRS